MGETPEPDLSPDDIYDGMEVLEPYKVGELAAYFDAPKRRIRELLKRLSDSGAFRKKQPEPERAIWIRDPPVHECPDCRYAFGVKFLHPVLSSVRFCPRCGTQV